MARLPQPFIVALASLAMALSAATLPAQGPGPVGLTIGKPDPAAATGFVATKPTNNLFAPRDTVAHSKWKTGAIIGAAIGLPVGVIGFGSESEGATHTRVRDAALGGLATAALFGLVGALIGSFFH